MKKLTLMALSLMISLTAFCKSSPVNINVHYFDQKPFAYMENGKMGGIEYEIIMAFSQWAKEKKNTDIKLNFKGYESFDEFFRSVAAGSPDDIGMGTVTINDERKEKVLFSAPYLNNISLLITDGRIKTLETMEDVAVNFKGLNGITIKGSTHEIYMEELKKFLPGSTMQYVSHPSEIPVKIAADPKLFGYVDIITYWTFLKNNDHFIKIHRIANRDHESLGFIFPKNSEIIGLFNEFFESGFGFTATKKYHEILEKYMSHEILTTVEMN